jgi:hypothetical protein
MDALIIGDSHVLRLIKTLVKPKPHSDCICKEKHSIYTQGLPVEVKMSWHKGKCAWKSQEIINQLNPCVKKNIKKETIILPFFGFIDCKIQLNRYDDVEETVSRYMQAYFDAFPENEIRFIEPMPQFIDDQLIGNGKEIHKFESRYNNYKKFVYYLRSKSEINGLKKPISIENILGVDQLDESYECHECAYCLEPESIGIRWDHLKFNYNKIICEEILKEIM